MQTLTCNLCRNRVLVEKNSWHHTSIQWPSGSKQTCVELGDATSPVSAGMVSNSCSALRDSIRRAAANGRVPVPE